MKAIDLLKQNWKPVAGAGLVVAAFFLGRATVPQLPERIIERTEVVEKVQYVDRWHERETIKEVRVKDTTSNLKMRKEITQTKLPDGTETYHEIQDLGIDRVIRETDVKTVDRVIERVVTLDREVEKKVEVRVEAPKKDWLVGPMIGFDLSRVGIREDGINIGDLSVGAHVQRRIIGPAFLGAYGTHTGQAGLTLQFEF